MLVLSIVLIVLALFAYAWLGRELRNAPFGWEDEGGWHEGEEPTKRLDVRRPW